MHKNSYYKTNINLDFHLLQNVATLNFLFFRLPEIFYGNKIGKLFILFLSILFQDDVRLTLCINDSFLWKEHVCRLSSAEAKWPGFKAEFGVLAPVPGREVHNW